MGDWKEADTDDMDDDFIEEDDEESSAGDRLEMMRISAAHPELARRREIEFRLEEKRLRDELGIDDFRL